MSRELSCQSTGGGELPVRNGRVGEWGSRTYAAEVLLVEKVGVAVVGCFPCPYLSDLV